jgi:hypothetical protein
MIRLNIILFFYRQIAKFALWPPLVSAFHLEDGCCKNLGHVLQRLNIYQSRARLI